MKNSMIALALSAALTPAVPYNDTPFHVTNKPRQYGTAHRPSGVAKAKRAALKKRNKARHK